MPVLGHRGQLFVETMARESAAAMPASQLKVALRLGYHF